MGEKWTPLKPGFQHPISICVIIEVYWWCFGDELGSGWVMVAPLSCSLGQNWPKPQARCSHRSTGSSISSQTLSVVQLYDIVTIYMKKGACPEFCLVPPLWQTITFFYTFRVLFLFYFTWGGVGCHCVIFSLKGGECRTYKGNHCRNDLT